MIAYDYAEDCRDIASAKEYLDAALIGSAGFPPLYRDALLVEAAYFEAGWMGHPEGGRWLLKQRRGGSPFGEKYAERTAEAAIAIGTPDAMRLLEEAEQLLSEASQRRPVDAYRERLARLRTIISHGR